MALSASVSAPRAELVSSRQVARRAQTATVARAAKLAVTSSVDADDIPEVLRSTHGPLFFNGAVDRSYLDARTNTVRKHFPGALGIDDFMARTEIALYQQGFTGDNTIAFLNLCRDEVCHKLAHKVHAVFGYSFSTHGLGGVLTCGVTGMKAGISHAPNMDEGGRERYVFFSFPHIAIDSDGNVGNIYRPARLGDSSACGALIASLNAIKAGEGDKMDPNEFGKHDATDPELSILKQRLVRTIRRETINTNSLDLVSITKLAEKTHTRDLEQLIEAAVDRSKADYAIVTGVQIHNWAAYPRDPNAPDLEYVFPSKVVSVVRGVETEISLTDIPNLTPRQIRTLVRGDMDASVGEAAGAVNAAELRKRMRFDMARAATGK